MRKLWFFLFFLIQSLHKVGWWYLRSISADAILKTFFRIFQIRQLHAWQNKKMVHYGFVAVKPRVFFRQLWIKLNKHFIACLPRWRPTITCSYQSHNLKRVIQIYFFSSVLIEKPAKEKGKDRILRDSLSIERKWKIITSLLLLNTAWQTIIIITMKNYLEMMKK